MCGFAARVEMGFCGKLVLPVGSAEWEFLTSLPCIF